MKIWQRGTDRYLEEPEYGGGALRFLYETIPGRALLRVAVDPRVSRWRGRYQSSPASRKDILPFAERCGVDLTGYDPAQFSCFNDFFARRRENHTDAGETELVAVADSRLSVWPVSEELELRLKHSRYTLREVVGGGFDLAPFAGGHCLVFRLAVQDYHRYVFPDAGRVVQSAFLPGELHTVRSVSERYRVYARNSRAVTLLETAHFGPVLQIEVGAMLVGAIRNHPVTEFVRLQEKGYFEYGGSTILLLVPANVRIDEDLLHQSRLGYETQVTIGEKIGGIEVC